MRVEYRLISKKGEGTFSEVLKAQSIKTGKFVAIKRICVRNGFEDENIYSIKQEVKLLMKLRHPNIVQCLGRVG